jgi:hypothetical protein
VNIVMTRAHVKGLMRIVNLFEMAGRQFSL